MKRSQLWALQRLITYFYIHREKTKNEGNSARSAEWENVKWLTYEVFQNKINCQGHFYKKKEKCMVLYQGRFQTLFCTQCTKFKIVPYDILRCAHRTFECATRQQRRQDIFCLIRNVNCIFRRAKRAWYLQHLHCV